MSLRLKLGEFEKMLAAYDAMLGYTAAVTRCVRALRHPTMMGCLDRL